MSQPGMWLEIRRGKTNFPLRPVSGDRFLIGAGSHCHLQLGGDDVPMLHSLLVIENNKAYLEAVVCTPPLVINGESHREVELHDEDTVQIGLFEFVFHCIAACEPSSQVATNSAPMISVSLAHDTEEDLASLSMAELIQRMEDESDRICSFERARERGAAALLEAVRQAACNPAVECVPIKSLRGNRGIADTAEQLRMQSQRLSKREADYLARLKQLQQAQEQLAQQVADFARQVSAWSEEDNSIHFRASA